MAAAIVVLVCEANGGTVLGGAVTVAAGGFGAEGEGGLIGVAGDSIGEGFWESSGGWGGNVDATRSVR